MYGGIRARYNRAARSRVRRKVVFRSSRVQIQNSRHSNKNGRRLSDITARKRAAGQSTRSGVARDDFSIESSAADVNVSYARRRGTIRVLLSSDFVILNDCSSRVKSREKPFDRFNSPRSPFMFGTMCV